MITAKNWLPSCAADTWCKGTERNILSVNLGLQAGFPAVPQLETSDTGLLLARTTNEEMSPEPSISRVSNESKKIPYPPRSTALSFSRYARAMRGEKGFFEPSAGFWRPQ